MTIHPLPGTFAAHSATESDVRLAFASHRLDETVVLRHGAWYRKVLRGRAMGISATVLRFARVAEWARHAGVSVEVGATDELELAVKSRIPPDRVIVRLGDCSAALISRAVEAGASRVILNTADQVDVVAAHSEFVPRVLVDVGGERADDLLLQVVSQHQLDLVGVHLSLEGAAHDVVGDAISQLAWLRRAHRVSVTRLSLAGFGGPRFDPPQLRRYLDAVDDGIELACIRCRYPRPALTVWPSPPALLPR